MSEDKRTNLGRGLSALLGEDSADYAELDKVRGSKEVPIEFLHPGPFQPRRRIDDSQIKDLAQSVREKGILQPILVRRHPDEANSFEIIAGERRWRAAQMAKLHQVPVVIKDLSDRETLEIALVENLQRQDLSSLEEAEGYRRLMDEFDHTQEGLGKALGKSRSHVANMMRLLALPDSVKLMMDEGALSAGHARALLNAKEPEKLARRVVKRGLNVRQTEKLVQAQKAPRRGKTKTAEKDTDTQALERDLSAVLGLKAEITFRGGAGTLKLHYNSLEQLDDILNRLSKGAVAPAADPFDESPLDYAGVDTEDLPTEEGLAEDILAADGAADGAVEEGGNGADEMAPVDAAPGDGETGDGEISQDAERPEDVDMPEAADMSEEAVVEEPLSDSPETT